MAKTTKRPTTAGLSKHMRRGGRICGICTSPHRKFIEDAIAAGYSKPAVMRYMEELDIKLPYLNHHFAAKHHVKAA